MKLNWDDIEFSSGRKIYTCVGTVGINIYLEAKYGHDGDLCEFDKEKLSPDEKRELADHMIGLWTQYKEKA